MFPNSKIKITTLQSLAQIIKLFDNPTEMIHAIYLIFKSNIILLNEMHIRIIVKIIITTLLFMKYKILITFNIKFASIS